MGIETDPLYERDPEEMIMEMKEKRVYTVDEVKEILGISRPAVYNLIKSNEFRTVQLNGGKYRISKRSFDNWLDKGDVQETGQNEPEQKDYTPRL